MYYNVLHKIDLSQRLWLNHTFRFWWEHPRTPIQYTQGKSTTDRLRWKKIYQGIRRPIPGTY